ncbi:membrane protein [Acetobacter indonesiensis]|nr:membrane protein [Acetobacter indonesiensis]
MRLRITADTTTDTWTGAAGTSNWNDAGNWSNGVPTSTSDVVIDSGTIQSALSITLPPGGSSASISSLTITGGGSVTFDGSLNSTYKRTTLIVNGNVTVPEDNVTTLNHVNLISSGNVSGGTIFIAKGSTIQANVTTPITFSPTNDGVYPNTLYLTGSGTPPSITNFSHFDSITFGSLISGDTNQHNVYIRDAPGSTGSTYEIYDETTDTVLVSPLTMAPGEDVTKITWQSDAGTLNCFLSGSLIRTPSGDVAVEEISIGDEVITFDWKTNQEISQQVIWVGKANTQVKPHLSDDEAGWPVRILKNAISEGVPFKDMLITPEHCLFFEGKFVPARMLVNGASIFFDKSITSYDYYHVETAQHSVITADGILTESYLDTGNRASFSQEGKVVSILRGIGRTWEDDAAAPLCVDRAFVEPLFHKIVAQNANLATSPASATTAELVTDPDLHLITDNGAVIRPIRHNGQIYNFMLPANVSSVRIVSRASRPSDVVGPFIDDRRYFGVSVAEVHLLCAEQQFDITAHLQSKKPKGWLENTDTKSSWTNGDAELPLGDHLVDGKIGLLSMTINAAGPYVIKDKQDANREAKSA